MTNQPIDTAADIVAPIRFQVRHGTQKITCTVSIEALEDASGLPRDSAAQLHRRSFDRFRTLIEAAAQQKLATLPADFAAPLVLTSADLRRVPHTIGMATYAQPPRRSDGA